MEQITRKQKQAKYALERYHRLSAEEKKALSQKRSLQQKRKRQQKKELMELEAILRASNDIVEIPPEIQNPHPKSSSETSQDLTQKEKNARKALRARIRYHNMTPEERKRHNQRRSESFKKVREEEQSLLRKPLSEVKSEDIDRIEEILSKKARTARNARSAYQRMTPEERKAYNKKRMKYYIPKRKSKDPDSLTNSESVSPDLTTSPEPATSPETTIAI